MIKIYNEDSIKFLKKFSTDKNIVFVTDPPFNINYNYNTYKDNLDEKKYYELLTEIFLDSQHIVIHYPEFLHKYSIYSGICPQKICSWVYNSNLPKQHRDIAFYNIKPDFSQCKQPYKNTEDKRIKELIKNGNQADLYDWWEFQQVKNVSAEKSKHPCQMPIGVMLNIINLIPKDSLVIDPFMGSGTTGIACNHLGLDFVGLEIDKKYFDIADDRIKNFKIQQKLF